MITENNVVPLFGIPLCQTQIKPYEESEKFIKEKLDYELRSHKVSYISKDDYVLDRDNLLPLKTEILQKVGEFMHGYLDVHEKHKFVLCIKKNYAYVFILVVECLSFFVFFILVSYLFIIFILLLSNSSLLSESYAPVSQSIKKV